jgi:hypothetical protein
MYIPTKNATVAPAMNTPLSAAIAQKKSSSLSPQDCLLPSSKHPGRKPQQCLAA